MKNDMKFEPLYYADRLHVLNPCGSVGVVTLWSPIQTVINCFLRIGVDLNPNTSKIAVLGNLYGNGLSQLICNLLYNPQITTIIIIGQDLSGSAIVLTNLLTKGYEVVEYLGSFKHKILETSRHISMELPIKELLLRGVRVYNLGKPSALSADSIDNLYFIMDKSKEQPVFTDADRIAVDLPVNQPRYFPSEPRSHTIVRKRPIDAWEEVVCRVLRFGIPSIASVTKRRLELQNLKVVITDPVEEADEHLKEYGFSLEELQNYQDQLIDSSQIEHQPYTYGNRLRNYWYDELELPLDQLEIVAHKLNKDPTDRDTYITLWDPKEDLLSRQSVPCLVSLFFRVFEGKLTLTATFRAHNVMSAWLKNLYGLISILNLVSELGGNIPKGAITIISHSITIDPESMEDYDKAQTILKSKVDDSELDRTAGKRNLREDPNGHFVFTIDKQNNIIIVDHMADGELLTQYRGKTADEISSQLACDSTISDIGHALYVGRQLAIHEQKLKR